MISTETITTNMISTETITTNIISTETITTNIISTEITEKPKIELAPTNYMFRPGYNPYNNCVAYSEFYYISSYNQYKSLPIYQCPEEAKYYIKKRKSCIDDCKKDEEYKYLYNGNCLKQCPSGTRDINYVCVLSNNLCTLGKNEIFLSYNDNLEIISTLIKSYISEFYYTDNYVSHYQHTNYSIMIYKNRSCITELNLQMPNVDFQSCYTKVQNEYSINQDLIIVIP